MFASKPVAPPLGRSISALFYRYVNPDLTRDECIDTVKNDLALVTIEISMDEMDVTTRDASISFEEKLGIVGNQQKPVFLLFS